MWTTEELEGLGKDSVNSRTENRSCLISTYENHIKKAKKKPKKKPSNNNYDKTQSFCDMWNVNKKKNLTFVSLKFQKDRRTGWEKDLEEIMTKIF